MNWPVQEAFKGETPILVISQSVTELFKSSGNQQYTYEAIAAMRHGFGTHTFGEDEHIREERIPGRVTNESRYELEREDDRTDSVGPVDNDD